jgi:hypothetical protein
MLAIRFLSAGVKNTGAENVKLQVKKKICQIYKKKVQKEKRIQPSPNRRIKTTNKS